MVDGLSLVLVSSSLTFLRPVLFLQVCWQDGEQRRPGARDTTAGRVFDRTAHPQHGEERHVLNVAARLQASSGPSIETLVLPSPLSE